MQISIQKYKRYLLAEVTNSGSETLSTDETWFFFDGSSPHNNVLKWLFSSNYEE